MLNLVISPTEDLIVEVFDGDKKISEKCEICSVQSEDILKMIKQKIGMRDFSEVDNILLNVGPGSFTGIRASMALVFGLTRTGNPRIVPFTTFDMFEYDKLSGDMCRVVTGFSNFVYAEWQDKQKRQMKCLTVNELGAFARLEGKTIVAASNKLAEKFKAEGVSVIIQDLLPENVIQKFMKNTLEKRSVEPDI